MRRLAWRAAPFLLAPFALATLPGCSDRTDRPAAAPTETAAPGEAPTGQGPAALEALADALSKADDVAALRRQYVDELPGATPDQRAALEAQSTAADQDPYARLAATIALGTLVEPARSAQIRAALAAAMKQVTRTARYDSDDAVRVASIVWPPVAERLAATPDGIDADLPPLVAAERARWLEATAAAPLPALGPADVPYLVRHAVAPVANASWLARLLLATIDDPRATEALLYLPPAHYGQPTARRDLGEWAVVLHATLPGARPRLRVPLGDTAVTRARDRAAAALVAHRDPAAIDAITTLLDRVAGAPPVGGAPTEIALGPLVDAAADWGDARLVAALERYARSDAPNRNRAQMAVESAGAAPDRDALWTRVEAHPNDTRARTTLAPLLTADDAPRIAALLIRDRWADKTFFQYVRWLERVEPAALTGPVLPALEAVAREHENPRLREWALTALGRAPGELSLALTAAAERGSPAAVRAVIVRAPDPYAAARQRYQSDDDNVRRAAYEVLAAKATLPFEQTPERAAEIVEHAARHLLARPEDPFVFLRALRHHINAGRTAQNDALVLRALRPYAVSSDPQKKPWWDALLTVVAIDTPASAKLLRDAVAAVPYAKGRRVMRSRLGLPPDPTDVDPPEETDEAGHPNTPTSQPAPPQ